MMRVLSERERENWIARRRVRGEFVSEERGGREGEVKKKAKDLFIGEVGN